MAGNPALRRGLFAERGADGCTTIIVQPERTPDGTLIHAHNWDWKASCAETCVVLRVRGDGGPDILTFTEAGTLARFGRSEEHTSELQSLMRISYAVFCLKKKNTKHT